jgi:hypothetical protein
MIELLKKIIREEGDGRLSFLLDIESLPEEWGLETVASYGGEDKGKEYWFVIYSKELNEYVKCTGEYDSEEGVDFYEDCFKVVKPIQKMVTVYV